MNSSTQPYSHNPYPPLKSDADAIAMMTPTMSHSRLLTNAMMQWARPVSALSSSTSSPGVVRPASLNQLELNQLEWARRSMPYSTHPQASLLQVQDSMTPVASATLTKVSPPTTTKKRTRTKKPRGKAGKRYNSFNIFFMLERQYLLHSRGGGIDAIANPVDVSDSPLLKYDKELKLPALCARYSHLKLTDNWFLELQANQQGKNRLHRKSHGLIPFKELAGKIAKSYREINDETRNYVKDISEKLGKHCDEIEALDGEKNVDQVEESGGSVMAVATSLTSVGVTGRIGDCSAAAKRKAAPVAAEPIAHLPKRIKTLSSPTMPMPAFHHHQQQQQAADMMTVHRPRGYLPKRPKAHSPQAYHHLPPAAVLNQPVAVDSKSDNRINLEFELTRAIQARNAHLESERRIELKIQLLSEMIGGTGSPQQGMRTQQPAQHAPLSAASLPNSWYRRHHNSSALAADTLPPPPFQQAPSLSRAQSEAMPTPTSLHHNKTSVTNPSANLMDLEQELLQEELIRRLARLSEVKN